MRQAIHQPLNLTQMISFGFATALLSLFQLTPSVSAQQIAGPVSHETSGTGIQGRRIENIAPSLSYPTKSLEGKKKDVQASPRKPHRLIRKPQNAPIASVESSPSGPSSINPSPSLPPSLQSDNTTAQSKEPSLLSRSVGTVLPLATMSVAPSSGTATGSTAAGSASAGAIPLAAAGTGNSSGSGNGGAGGRSMRRLAAEMPGLAQLVAPIPAPILSINPTIGTSPTSLSFTAQQGSGNPTAQALTISNTGGGTLSWSASDSTTWLSLSPASGTGTGTITVSVTTGPMTAGTYSGIVTLSATGASSVTVPITFTITAAPVTPAIGASPTSLSFSAQAGVNPTAQTLTISNSGGGTLAWSASDNAAWLALSPASGTGNSSVTLTVTTATLTAGSYSGLITLTATGATTVTVPVALTVTAAPVPPAIGASPISLSFTAQQGSANPTAQALTISNTGGGTLTWSASDNAAWLTLSPASGAGSGTVTATATLGTLTTGTYNGTITLSATGASPASIPVVFTVTAAPVPPAIGTSPTSLSFAATQGGTNPAAQTLTISNTGGGTLTWSASDNASWLTISPASGTGNGTAAMNVTTGTLTAGSYTGTVTIVATGATSVTVPVTFTVATPSVPPAISLTPTSLSYTATQGGANPAGQTLNIRNSGGGTLTWSISDNAAWLTLSPATGTTTTETDPVTVSINTAGLAPNTYNGLITVSGTGVTSQTVSVALTVSAAATQSATLQWNPNTTDPDLSGYKVYQATASGAYSTTPIATLPKTSTSYVATGLQVGTTYFFVIKSFDTAGNESLPSNEVSKSIY